MGQPETKPDLMVDDHGCGMGTLTAFILSGITGATIGAALTLAWVHALLRRRNATEAILT